MVSLAVLVPGSGQALPGAPASWDTGLLARSNHPLPAETEGIREGIDAGSGDCPNWCSLLSLLYVFEKASMHINPNSTFWVNDVSRNMLLLKKPQYYDSHDGQVSPAKDNSNHYRVTFVYFRSGKLFW